jgi:hypothetical protein
MKYVFLALFPFWIALVLYSYFRLRRSRPSDYEAIDDMLKARSLQRIAVTKHYDLLRYWIRGYLSLSNVARFYIVTADEQNGSRREIHVAFDAWSWNGGLRVLLDIELPTQREVGSAEAVAEFLKQREALERAKENPAEPLYGLSDLNENSDSSPSA